MPFMPYLFLDSEIQGLAPGHRITMFASGKVRSTRQDLGSVLTVAIAGGRGNLASTLTYVGR